MGVCSVPGSKMCLAAVVTQALLLSLVSCQQEDVRATYQDSLATTVADFTQSIYVHLATTSDKENFVFSPLSLHSALSLLYLATKPNSTTQNELGGAMGKINSPELVNEAYKSVLRSYEGQNSFLYGNHIWVSNKFEVDPSYKSMVTKNFGAKISKMYFDRVGAVQKVNKWVQKLTNNKVQNLVDSFTGDTQMFLANAVYFKDKWMIPFEEVDLNGKKLEKDFRTDSGLINVPMVWQDSEDFVYGEIETKAGLLQAVTIPYENQQFEMQIILPEKNIKFLEHMLKSGKDRDAFDSTSFNLFTHPKNISENQYKEIHLKFPLFQVKSKVSAAEALKSLGATEVFSSGAELDKITAEGPVGVGNIIHEAVVEVSKDGSEAAAATGIELTLLSSGFKKHIVVDKPFIFIIHDRVNNIPIIVGRIKNPTIKLP